MIEKEFKLTQTNEKTVEKVVMDENIHYIHEYEAGTLLKIPFQTKMNVKNLHSQILDLIVVKAPAPKS